MATRRGAVSFVVALGATALAQFALVAAAGCGEFGVESGGGDAAATAAETAPPGIDGAAPEAAPTADASTMGDAGCGSHSFCADFEQGLAEMGWSAKHTMVGTLGIASSAGSPGRALESSIDAQSGPSNYAYLAQDFPGATGIHLELEMKLPAATFAPATVITLVQISGEVGTTSGVGLVLSAQPAKVGFYLAHGDGTSESVPSGFDIPRGQWVHLVFELRFGAKGSLMVTVPGQPAVNEPLSTVVPATPQLRVGVQHYNGATPQFSVLYDTIRVDLL